MATTNTDRAVEELQSLADSAEALLDSAEGQVSEKTLVAREKLMAAIERAKTTCRKLEDKAIAGARATDQAIRTHPYESMFVSFGLGLVVGLLLRKK